jgi:hypothetical protein
MSCERCAEAAASGAKICGYCGQDLELWVAPGDHFTTPTPDGGLQAQSTPGGRTPAARVLMFVGGFFLALLLMGMGAAIGGAAAGIIGAFIGGVGAPVGMILLAKANAMRPLAAGGITAVAIVVIVFGGCLMLLSGTNFH